MAGSKTEPIGTEHLGEKNWDRTAEKGQSRQVGLTGQSGKGGQVMTARKDSCNSDRRAGAGQTG